MKKRYNADKETLRHWKNTSVAAKLQWLSDALEFFGNPKKTRKGSRV